MKPINTRGRGARSPRGSSGTRRPSIPLGNEKMRAYTRLTVTGIVSSMSACAAVGPSPDQIAKSAQFEQTTPVCKETKECEVMWAAARDWVLSNISWKIQTISDDFIQTFSPPLGEITLAATVRKQPQMDGSYRIIVSTYCNNAAWGFCSPDSWEAALDFNRAVNAAVGR